MIKVSACIITYNHEKYIKDCLDGALAQKVNFDYEIVVSEDCSTDNTRKILLDYQKKYPDKIKLFLNEKNLGLSGNWLKSWTRCNCDYMAICEGDDYWTNPNKLQKQIDFLEANPDFALSSHNANVMQDGKFIRVYCPPNHPEIMDLSYLLTYGSGVATCSLVIRKKTIENLPDWLPQMHSHDLNVQILAARYGKMKYFSEIMGVYRKTKTGAGFTSKIEARKEGKLDFALPPKYSLEMNENWNKYFNYKYDKQIRCLNTYWYNWYVDSYLEINDIKMARVYALKILKEIPLFFKYRKRQWLTSKRFFKLLSLFLPYFMQQYLKMSFNFFKKLVMFTSLLKDKNKNL